MNAIDQVRPAAPASLDAQEDARIRDEHRAAAHLSSEPEPLCEAPGDLVAVVERRQDDRAKVSVYRSAVLRWGGREGLCLIRNFSPSGLMCCTPFAANAGDRVAIEMRSGRCVGGTVAWARDGRIGVRFDDRVDVAAALNGGCDASPEFVQRMPRLHMTAPVTLMADAGSLSAVLLDLSQGGAKVDAPFLSEGERVTLFIPDLAPHAGTIRWTRDGLAGVAFLSPIRFDTLARWAAERDADQRVGTGSDPE